VQSSWSKLRTLVVIQGRGLTLFLSRLREKKSGESTTADCTSSGGAEEEVWYSPFASTLFHRETRETCGGLRNLPVVFDLFNEDNVFL
jgi:hypothetical protein